MWDGEGVATTCGDDVIRDDGGWFASWWPSPVGSLWTRLRDGGGPDQKSAASVPAQGGNEGTDAADSLAMGNKRRGRDRKGAIDARHLRGGGASPNIGSAEQRFDGAVCLFFFEKLLDMRLATGGDVSAKKK